MAETPVRIKLANRKPARGDRLFFGISSLSAMISLTLVFLILLFLGQRSLQTFIDQGWAFVTGSTWDATLAEPVFQIFPMLYGSVLVSLIGLVIAVPTSIAVAYFIEYMAARPIARIATLLVDLLAALPSILIGMWGVLVFSPVAASWSKLITVHLGHLSFFENRMDNALRSPFIAGWVVAIMIIPIITSVSREVMSRVDRELIAAAYALGGTAFSVMRRVVIPNSRSGILGGILLGLGRALGETVAIFYVLNLVFKINFFHILEPEGGSIASVIIAKFGEAESFELDALMAAGVVLFVITLIINMIATGIVQRAEKKMAS